jgi:hypothetical protein
MLKTAARFLVLRVLPRRIVPVVAVVEALLFLRGLRRRSRVRVNAPSASRTAPPPRPGPDWGAKTGPAPTDGPAGT